MQFLVLSDIHGNRHGLEAVLADAEDEYEQLLCLGDIVGYGAFPNECCDTLRAENALCLSGNHDAAALDLLDIQWFNPVALEAILWTRQQLNSENQQWLQNLPAQLDFPEHDFQAVHASLREPWEEYITGPEIAAPNLRKMQRSLCFFGHTHQAVVFGCPRDEKTEWWRDGFRDMMGALITEGGMLELEPDFKYLLNPGSCGQPRDGNEQAKYAIFDSQARSVEVRAIDYDIEGAQRAINAAGLPKMLADRLSQGR